MERSFLRCIKCGTSEEEFQQDSRGCEYFKDVTIPNAGDSIFLCSKCITNFEYSQDRDKYYLDKIFEIKDIVNIGIPDCRG